MKAEHRHELKTNELAEWIANLPDWAKRNATTITVVCVVAASAVGSYLYFRYQRNVASLRERLRLTELAASVMVGKQEILVRQFRGIDLSFTLLDLAGDLKNFADGSKNDRMSALALIKRAEALRAELHYRPKTIDMRYLTRQIEDAKASYRQAVERSLSCPPLKAVAEFGLGLCEEELGNFENARQIYRDIVENPDYESTITVVQAKQRLETMAEYQKRIVFRPAPKPKPVPLTPPLLPPSPLDVNLSDIMPPAVNLPGVDWTDFNFIVPEVGPTPEGPNEKPLETGRSDANIADINMIDVNLAMPELGT